MPDLQHTLQGNDLGFLRIVAEAWTIELNAPDAYTALPILVSAMHDQTLLNEVIETLPRQAQTALQTLMINSGQMTWAQFSRKFGDIRVMGAGKRDRERPDLNPTSAAEILWYHGLIGKVFLNLPPEPQEYAYIPSDLQEKLSFLSPETEDILGRAASPLECAHTFPVNDVILDHACTFLAALRIGLSINDLDTHGWTVPPGVILELLKAAKIVDKRGTPQPEAVRIFLGDERGKALAKLVQAWISSTIFNELFMLDNLVFEGEWQNNPYRTRQTLLAMFSHLPQDRWWSISAFLSAVKERQPDFQRPAGDYDSWFIRKVDSETYLRGFKTWDEVDGALIRFMITGPLHWLGVFDLAAPTPEEPPAAFRPSVWASSLWHGNTPAGMPKENKPLRSTAEGVLKLHRLTPRAVRYQVARFCHWEDDPKGTYQYRLTPESLQQAAKNGLKINHLLALLRRHSKDPIPPRLVEALERWEKEGVQAVVSNVSILRVSSAEILETLNKSRASRYLLENLNPTTAIIKAGSEERIRSALLEAGYLGEIDFKS